MDSNNRLQHISNCLVEYRKLWLFPAIAGLLLATVYAFLIQGESWTARQTMIIRDDLLGQNFKPGTFISEESMKSAQETVLETARRPEVVRKVLEELGPETTSFLGLGSISSSWPSDQTIEDYRGNVSFESANGGEFGKSEVIVLAAQSSSPKRSVEFLSLLLTHVDKKLSEIRADRFESMEAELRATCESALKTREKLEDRVKEMDASFGTDILVFSSFNGGNAGSPSAFETKLNEIKLDIRTASRKLSELQSQKRALAGALNSSYKELPSSAELLANQPTLANKYESLSKARQKLSEAAGMYTSSHPAYKAAKQQVEAVIQQIRASMGTVARGLDSQITAQKDAIELLEALYAKNSETLKRVSRHRAPYMAATKELDKQNEDYSDASARLARMQSRKLASDSIKLLTRIGDPWIGTRPDGMGKRALALVGGIAGLLIGLGLVMIVAPPYVDETAISSAEPEERETTSSQRLADYLPENRRTEPEPPPVSAATNQQVVSPPPAPAPISVPVPTQAETTASSIEDAVSSSFESNTPPAAEPTPPVVQVPVPPVEQVPSPPVVQTPESIVQIPTQQVSPAPATPTIQIPVPVAPQTPETQQPSYQPQSMVEPVMPQAPTIPQVQFPETFVAQPERTISEDTIESLMPTEETMPESDHSIVSVETQPQPQSQPEAATRPASRTLAAIFANMPQPRTDIAVETEDSPSPGDDEALPTREETQTIQLQDDAISGAGSLPLQRRTAHRPIDLAKTETDLDKDQNATSRHSIDDVFSELKPGKRRPR